MDLKKLEKSLIGNGASYKYFETKEEAKDYLLEALSGTTVGIGGSMTVEALGIYDELCEKSEVHWHWKTQPIHEVHKKAAVAEAYICSANGISEDGVIVNIDGTGNRIASMFFGHKRLFIVAGVNKIRKTYEEAVERAWKVASPLNAKRFGLDESKIPSIAKGVATLIRPMNGQKLEVIIINEELGY